MAAQTVKDSKVVRGIYVVIVFWSVHPILRDIQADAAITRLRDSKSVLLKRLYRGLDKVADQIVSRALP